MPFNHALRPPSSSSRRPRAGSATLRGARCPSPQSPPIAVAPPHRWRGATAFNNALRQSLSSRRPRAGSASLRGARCPSPPSLPSCTAPLTTVVRCGASPAPRRGAASSNHALRPLTSPRRPRGPSRVSHAAQGPLPLAAFTALLSPSPSSPRVFAEEHHPHPGGVPLLSTMRSDHCRLHVTLVAPRAGSATPRKARCPRPPSPPCYHHRTAHHGCSPRSIARTQEGCRCFQTCFKFSTVIISTSP